MGGEGEVVALLELELAPLVSSDMAALGAYPAAFREDHRHRLFLDHRVQRNIARRRGLGERRPPPTARGVGALDGLQSSEERREGKESGSTGQSMLEAEDS